MAAGFLAPNSASGASWAMTSGRCALTHPTGDELRVLGTEVDDQDGWVLSDDRSPGQVYKRARRGGNHSRPGGTAPPGTPGSQ